MKKQNQVILFAIVLVLGTLSYCHFRKKTPEMVPVNSEEDIGTAPVPVANKSKANVPPPTQKQTEASFLPTEMEDPARFEALQKNLQDMAGCLNMKFGPLDPQSDFNFETLLSVIGPDLGDIVMRNDEWTATDIRTPQGEVRRIYLEMSANYHLDGQRSLKYFSMSPGGGQKEIPLSTDQNGNPSETLLASLESDGAVIGTSRSQRTFFENGDNLLTVEKNGKIYSFQLPHDGKVFMCSGVDTRNMKCVCK